MGPAALEQGKLPMQRVADEYVSLVKQEDADPNKQNEAIEDLRFYAPNDPEVVNALVKFYSRPIGRHYLDALRNNRFKDFRIPDLVIASLHDPDPDVRGTAASVLGDMGPDALMRAEPALKALAEDPAQPARVKEAANRSLKSLAEWERSRSH